MMFFRYSQWDGTQKLELDSDDLLAELTDDLLEHGDIRRALSRMMRQGMRNQDQRMMGLQEMLQRLRQRRQDTLNQYDMDSIVDQIQKMLEEILDTERQGSERRLQDAQDRLQRSDGSEGQDQNGQDGQDAAENRQDGGEQGENGDQDGDQGQQGEQGRQPGDGMQSPMGQRSQQGQRGQQQQGQRGRQQQGQRGQQGQQGQPSNQQGDSGDPQEGGQQDGRN
ncbi:MAG: hypothetical protein NTZ05_21495, partial [Chloroflexi bacterium]|nr:hypothetical protein [Chloroflexota bacterium]